MNPFLSIWLQPQATVAKLDRDKRTMVYVILSLLLYAAVQCLDSYIPLEQLITDKTNKITLPTLLSYQVGIRVIIPFVILIPLLLTGILSLKSKTNFLRILTIIAYALLPVNLLLIGQLLLPFFGYTPELQHIPYPIQLLLWIWTLRLTALGIAQYKNIKMLYAVILVLVVYPPFFFFNLIKL